MLSQISFSRLVFYSVVLLLLPFIFLFLHFSSKSRALDKISSQLELTSQNYLQKEQKQALNKACRKQFAKKDKYALEKALERLSLMKKEKEEIEKVMSKDSFFGNRPLEERWEFLNGLGNRISFSEGTTTAKFGIQEVVETLSHPIEIDTSDFKEILTLIEGQHPLFGQTLLLDFQIKRQVKESENEVFICTMKLLKREFL